MWAQDTSLMWHLTDRRRRRLIRTPTLCGQRISPRQVRPFPTEPSPLLRCAECLKRHRP